MQITFAPRGILQIDGAVLIFKNFSGAGSVYNREGDRNFAIRIDDEAVANDLIERGWNVKIKPARDEDEGPRMHLPVKVKFNDRGPNVYLKSGDRMVRLTEDNVGCLDNIDMLDVELDIRPFDWEVNGKTGRSAYLQAIHVTQNIDRFAARYNHMDDDYLDNEY